MNWSVMSCFFLQYFVGNPGGNLHGKVGDLSSNCKMGLFYCIDVAAENCGMS